MIRYDISPPLSPETAVWPGSRALERQIEKSLDDGDGYDLSNVISTVHIGAHADAPSHFGPGRDTIGAVDPNRYLGPCRVVRAEVGRRGLIGPEHLPPSIDVSRLLFRTDTFPDTDHFTEDFAAFAPDLVDAAADAGVELMGIDTPSVDPFDSTEVPTHHRMLARDVVGLEGLDLRAVPPGRYQLVALPLRLVGFDASPVRAVLLDP
ncbi:MAG: cyclase family protein [Acidimicrobiales bacterium]